MFSPKGGKIKNPAIQDNEYIEVLLHDKDHIYQKLIKNQ